jgi:ribonuclease J
LTAPSVRLIPLGGLGEFGLNMLALASGDDLIVIDAGLMFPEAELLGVDVVIPDITFLKQQGPHIRGILLTHAHEDHIGALPFILRELDVPVFGTRFTLALVRRRLEEHGLAQQACLQEIAPRQMFRLGPFLIDPIQVTHSTADCVAFAIQTPAGTIVHMGDFKIDPTPLDGRAFDLHALAHYGEQGVLALLSDSTNVERPGHTPSERAVQARLDDLIQHAPRKVFVSCFASSIHRIQQILDLAHAAGRKVVLLGRSLLDNIEIAHELGYLQIPDGLLVRPQDVSAFQPREILVLASGSQAEPLSALSRIAVDNHREVRLEELDTVILSARIIPGNERAIFRMIDHMFRHGALVHYESGGGQPVHVSGHASQEELRLVLNLVRPRFFIPIHGEYRQLFLHAALARQMNVVREQVLLVENGQPVELGPGGAVLSEPVPAGRVCVDAGSLEEIEDVVIRDRQHLAQDGVLIPIIAIDKHTGRIEGQPEIVSRGLVPPDDGQELTARAREIVLRTIEESNPEEKTDWTVMKEKIRTDLRRYLKRQMARRPLILPVILEV